MTGKGLEAKAHEIYWKSMRKTRHPNMKTGERLARHCSEEI
jgi:hypothetical protein